jgi:hypothetical protein
VVDIKIPPILDEDVANRDAIASGNWGSAYEMAILS